MVCPEDWLLITRDQTPGANWQFMHTAHNGVMPQRNNCLILVLVFQISGEFMCIKYEVSNTKNIVPEKSPKLCSMSFAETKGEPEGKILRFYWILSDDSWPEVCNCTAANAIYRGIFTMQRCRHML